MRRFLTTLMLVLTIGPNSYAQQVCRDPNIQATPKGICYILQIVFCILVSMISVANVAAFSLPDSGQTACYQGIPSYAAIPCASTGQDGEFNIHPMSFFDNGDGTVTDNNTGLMWQQRDDDITYNWYSAAGMFNSTYNL